MCSDKVKEKSSTCYQLFLAMVTYNRVNFHSSKTTKLLLRDKST